MIAAPNAHIYNGVIDMILIKNISRTTAFSIFLSGFKTGSYTKKSEVSLTKVKAFLLKPDNTSGEYISCDGEKISYDSVLAEIHPGLLRIFSLK
jgi:diacylglycerol kinase family enzyme